MSDEKYLLSGYRKKVVANALPTFMNTCEGGACGNEGQDAKSPDEFERSTIDALEAVKRIALSGRHHTQNKAVLRFIRNEIDVWLNQ